ncbi:MAG: FAD-dependent oxidoreductase, partial [Rhodospirillales bacterium]|nr:FAD-dependent oxidoreductase [Rhodospirillales bacterium]
GAAWLLSRKHEVVIYEREDRFGGHSCTVDAPVPGGTRAVDVGFIVFNQRNYPNLVALFDHLGVPTETSDMSFAVSLDEGRFEYGSSFGGYFGQRRNVVRPSFLRMTHDILRFNRLAPRLLEECEDLDFTIGNFIDDAGFSRAFRDRYLVPMASCIWSTPMGRMLDYPAQSFVRFFNNHGLLTVGPQLQWRTVSGGSRSYVERIATPLRARARLATPARAIRRGPLGAEVRDASGHWDRFDKIVLACHADQALALLEDADGPERQLLGRFAYSSNEQRGLHAIQGVRDTYFCGSYCGYGFHEDALSAGLDVAEQLEVRRPWPRPDEHRRIGDPPRVVADRPSLDPFPLPVAARS